METLSGMDPISIKTRLMVNQAVTNLMIKADLAFRAREYGKAKELYIDALKITVSLFGSTHPVVHHLQSLIENVSEFSQSKKITK